MSNCDRKSFCGGPRTCPCALDAYVGSPEFIACVRSLRNRQEAGEDFTLEQIAEALDLPCWFVFGSLDYAYEQRTAHIVIPDQETMQ